MVLQPSIPLKCVVMIHCCLCMLQSVYAPMLCNQFCGSVSVSDILMVIIIGLVTATLVLYLETAVLSCEIDRVVVKAERFPLLVIFYCYKFVITFTVDYTTVNVALL